MYSSSVSKNAPSLASCSFDKHGLIFIIFDRQHQHTFRNDMPVQLFFSLLFYLLYLLLNSCDGNDAFWRHTMLVKRSSSFSRKHRMFSRQTNSLVDCGIWGLTQECVYIVQPVRDSSYQSSASLTHGHAYHKTSSTKQLVNGKRG